jgi:hypothetical protein
MALRGEQGQKPVETTLVDQPQQITFAATADEDVACGGEGQTAPVFVGRRPETPQPALVPVGGETGQEGIRLIPPVGL